MRRLQTVAVLAAIGIFCLVASPAQAQWDYCIKDTAFSTLYEFSADRPGLQIRGQAFDTGPNFPAPITGSVNTATGIMSFSVGYLENDNSRHYLLHLPTFQLVTWEIEGTDSSIVEAHPGNMLFCTEDAPSASGTGARK